MTGAIYRKDRQMMQDYDDYSPEQDLDREVTLETTVSRIATPSTRLLSARAAMQAMMALSPPKYEATSPLE